MKKFILTLAAAVCCASMAFAKDIKTVVFRTAPEMHCANCGNMIKQNLLSEKGVADIVTDLKAKTITVRYDADKTTVDKLAESFAKINYTATIADGDCCIECPAACSPGCTESYCRQPVCNTPCGKQHCGRVSKRPARCRR